VKKFYLKSLGNVAFSSRILAERMKAVSGISRKVAGILGSALWWIWRLYRVRSSVIFASMIALSFGCRMSSWSSSGDILKRLKSDGNGRGFIFMLGVP